MHKSKWDNATLTKLNVFEQYVNDWLNVTLNFKQDNKAYNTLEIYDLFCGSGFDGTKTEKGSPKRLQAMGNIDYKDRFKFKMLPHRLNEPKQNKKPTLYFVNSMSDLFHEKIFLKK